MISLWRVSVGQQTQDIPDHLLVLSELTLQLDDVLRGRWHLYLTIVVKNIPEHLLVLCDPALQIDDIFT
jgi:hypothetical protein